MTRWRRVVVIGAAAVCGLWPTLSMADATQLSPSFSMNETEVGGTGDDSSGSANFNFLPGVDSGGSTLGDTAVGNSGSTSFQTGSGYNTDAYPALTFAVTSSNVNLGVLSSLAANTGTATFTVEDYTSYGYAVTIVGTGLTNGSHTITPLTTDTASSAGSEQFGLNTVANSSPVTIGANPVQVPSASFSYGVSGDGIHNYYAQTGLYRFNSGETIASAPKSSGQTNYTATFLTNITNTTNGGEYQANLTLVATGTY